MKIYISVTNFPTLSETFVNNQITELQNLGHEVIVIADRVTRNPSYKLPENIRVLAKQAISRWGMFSFLFSIIEKLPVKHGDKIRTTMDVLNSSRLSSADIIIAHFGWMGMRLARIKKRKKIPEIITIFHGMDIAVPYQAGEIATHYNVIFTHGARMLCVNQHFEQLLCEAGAQASKTGILRMGINCDEIPFHPPLFTQNNLKILSVCRLTEKKGIEWALKAVAHLKQHHPEIEVEYNIIGSGELEHNLKHLCKETGIESCVQFLGARDNAYVRGCLGTHNVFLLPSVTARNGDQEGIPVSLMEAMAAGPVCVSTFHSGIPELIENGRSGFLAPEKDDHIIAEKLVYIARHPKEMNTITRYAREKIEKEFNNKKINEDLHRLLLQLQD